MRAIAFYLPQFHPIAENDQWWGRGFTDWVNVAKARPLFRGHHQPQIPADLGYYDLRLRETRIAQAELARQYGLGGFCYYHYWFNGKLLLEKPLEAVLADREPDFPFCVCWANETWSQRWDGRDHDVLIGADLDRYDPEAHFEYLGKAFSDPRYIRVEGRPVFIVYRIDQFPDFRSTIGRWRAKAQSMGLPGIYLCALRSHMHSMSDAETIALGFDAIVGFEPHLGTLRPQLAAASRRHIIRRLLSRLRGKSFVVFDYAALVRAAERQDPAERRFPCVIPSWDNSSRFARFGALVIQNDDAELFEAWLRDAANRVASYPDDEQIVFINAWNEWAEGCHLEPDRRNGHRFLEAVRKVFGGTAEVPRQPSKLGEDR
ncbi:glycosyl hydrolase [Mycobacterium sp. 852014-52450_SCH5900713]|uniref:glycosyltransferase WbsX family protein n=1 Tax=Mycobacterium sp. 852014-52450_SCH5900713 TaxID=1834116 RepID=UPI00080207F7|nr:glycoside hydrolase family 99-like domain-containing protein [Mycobacterium sp. 852014-52450_SCH5900713]OBF98406.1 glycosyl hydrolase [Mycobacterium sp. 852014-52450_SCH5900713]